MQQLVEDEKVCKASLAAQEAEVKEVGELLQAAALATGPSPFFHGFSFAPAAGA